MRVGLTLKRAQHLLSMRIDEALRPLRLNLGLWAVLREMDHLPPGASASELARASFHTPQTLGGLLQRLHALGLIERRTGRGRIVEDGDEIADLFTVMGMLRAAALSPRDSLVLLKEIRRELDG